MTGDHTEDADYQLAMRLHKSLNGDTVTKRSQANEDDDLQYARQLQAQLIASDLDSSLQYINTDEEQRESVQQPKPQQKQKVRVPYKQSELTSDKDYLNQTQNLVHPEWELVDPNPDIYSMFCRFDEKFFQNRLGAVVVEWSKRMYSCAGICYQRSNRHVKEVIIRLSEPLLKLRPRKDLVETLLHEMIHAYFFILDVREGNGGHGPNFREKMNMINKVAGTNITVYHSFHDEVDAYRTHIWRCNGICQNHTPFKGWVKRTSNRAPGPSDQWWAKHQRDCGGTFMKVSEPSKPPKPPKAPKTLKTSKPPKDITNVGKTSKKVLPAVADPKGDIREWFKKPPTKKPATDDAVLGAVVPSKQDGSSFTSPSPWPKSKSKPTGSNIRSFADLTCDSDDDEPPLKTSHEKFPSFKEAEQGYTMPKTGNGEVRDIRKIRERRFGQKQKQPTSEKKKPSNDNIELWESYDDDVMVRDAPQIVINLADDESDSDDDHPPKSKQNCSKDNKITPPNAGEGSASKKRRRDTSDSEIQHWESIDEVDTVPVNLFTDDDDEEESKPPPSRRFPMSSLERSQNVKREVLEDESILFYEDDIVFIDDEFIDDEQDKGNDPAINPIGTAGNSLLLMQFRHQNDVVPSSSNRGYDEENDIVSCPICFDPLRRSELSNHLDGCSITLRVAPPSFKRAGGTKEQSKTSPRGRKRKSASTKETLRAYGYTESEVADLNLSTSSDSSMPASGDELTPRQRRQRNLFKSTVGCPKCGQELMGHQLEAHRRICPSKKRK